MSSHADAASIVLDYAKQAEKIREEAKVVPVAKNEFSTGVKFGQQAFLPVPKVDEGPLFKYRRPILISDGPKPPKVEDIQTKGYLNHIRYCYTHSYQIIHNLTFFVERKMLLNELVVTGHIFLVSEQFKKRYKDYFILINK